MTYQKNSFKTSSDN